MTIDKILMPGWQAIGEAMTAAMNENYTFEVQELKKHFETLDIKILKVHDTWIDLDAGVDEPGLAVVFIEVTVEVDNAKGYCVRPDYQCVFKETWVVEHVDGTLQCDPHCYESESDYRTYAS